MLSNPKITKVVVGVDSAIQLEEIIRATELGVTGGSSARAISATVSD